MDLRHSRPGHPFDDQNYPPIEVTRSTSSAVRDQHTALERRRADKEWPASVLPALNRERAAAGLPGVAAFAGGSLHVPGELLVSRADWQERAVVRNFLADQGFAEVTVDDERLAGGLVRLRAANMPPKRLRATLRRARAQGVDAAPHYVFPAAPVGKGDDNPERAAALGAFDSYPVAPGPGTPVVGVIDTGITDQHRSDGWLAGFADPPSQTDPLDLLPKDDLLDQAAGHGTFVAGIVAQVAPGATVRVHAPLATDGCGTDLDVAAAILAAVSGPTPCDILNLSLGGPAVDGVPPTAIRSALTQLPPDVLVVCAAGNDGTAAPVYPAAFAVDLPNVVSVAGLTADLRPAPWSSFGDWVRASTVAVGVRSTFVVGTESPDNDPRPETFDDPAWAVWSGTSFAAPQIAGAVARVCQLTSLPPLAAWEELRAVGLPSTGYGARFAILPTVPL